MERNFFFFLVQINKKLFYQVDTTERKQAGTLSQRLVQTPEPSTLRFMHRMVTLSPLTAHFFPQETSFSQELKL